MHILYILYRSQVVEGGKNSRTHLQNMFSFFRFIRFNSKIGKKKNFGKNSIWVLKISEFYGDFKAVAKTLKQKILSAKKRQKMKFLT
jgi:hypothetical protein